LAIRWWGRAEMSIESAARRPVQQHLSAQCLQ
jgi:hypothetical protein